MPLRRPRVVCKPRRKVRPNTGAYGGYWVSSLDINAGEIPVRNCFRESDVQYFNRTHDLAEANALPASPPPLAGGGAAEGVPLLVSTGLHNYYSTQVARYGMIHSNVTIYFCCVIDESQGFHLRTTRILASPLTTSSSFAGLYIHQVAGVTLQTPANFSTDWVFLDGN